MAANWSRFTLVSFCTCFRNSPSYKLLSLSRIVLQPCLRQFSYRIRPSNINISNVNRTPQYTPVARHYVKAKEKKGPSLRTWIAVGAVCVTGITGAVVYLGWPDQGIDGKILVPYTDRPLLLAFLYRAKDKVKETYELFAEPSSELLLPEPLTEPYYQPPYTLVIEMTDVLIHPEYDRKSGWRFRKRPGVDAFLSQCRTPLFEVVIYTHENGFSAAPILEGLDPNGFVMYRLFRDATKYTNGTHIKDLGRLNRDLSKVVMIDCDEKATAGFERNTIVLKKWQGDPDDKILMDLTPLLLAIATSNVDDVRSVLDYYRGEEDVVAAFKRNQAKLREQRDQQNARQNEQSSSGWGGLFGRSMFGGAGQAATQGVKKDV